MGIISGFFDIVFGPLLSLPDVWGILIVSIILSLLTTIIYKYATDQKLMKQLKGELKELQKEMKTLKDQPDKAIEVNKRAMETNMKYMVQSMKPMLFTFLPIILIFGWLQVHFAYDPLLTNHEYTLDILTKDFSGEVKMEFPAGIELTSDDVKEVTNSKVTFTFKPKELGEYIAYVYAGDSTYEVPLVVHEKNYGKVVQKQKGIVKQIVIGNNKKKVLNLFGWKLGWLGTYILFSIASSMILRKWFKVY